jgi:hypothetical protein
MTQETENTRENNDEFALDFGLGRSPHKIRIGDRIFSLDPVSIEQYDDFERLPENDIKAQLAYLAPILTERAEDGEPVEVDFLRKHIPRTRVGLLTVALLRGEVPKAAGVAGAPTGRRSSNS